MATRPRDSFSICRCAIAGIVRTSAKRIINRSRIGVFVTMRRMKTHFLCVMLFASAVAAQEPQKACRSVHLWHQAPEAAAFYNEVTVERSASGTYFCVCGWDMGYFG